MIIPDAFIQVLDVNLAQTFTPSVLLVTDRAAAKVRALIEDEGNPRLKLRVFVTGGGCSGFQYGFSFEEAIEDDDRRRERWGRGRRGCPQLSLLGRLRNRLYRRVGRGQVRRKEPQRYRYVRVRLVLFSLSAGCCAQGELRPERPGDGLR